MRTARENHGHRPVQGTIAPGLRCNAPSARAICAAHPAATGPTLGAARRRHGPRRSRSPPTRASVRDHRRLVAESGPGTVRGENDRQQQPLVRTIGAIERRAQRTTVAEHLYRHGECDGREHEPDLAWMHERRRMNPALRRRTRQPTVTDRIACAVRRQEDSTLGARIQPGTAPHASRRSIRRPRAWRRKPSVSKRAVLAIVRVPAGRQHRDVAADRRPASSRRPVHAGCRETTRSRRICRKAPARPARWPSASQPGRPDP